MSEQDLFGKERRRILKLLGSSAAIVPLAGLTACSGGDEASAPAPAEKAAESGADAAKDTSAAADSMQETMEDGMDEAAEAADTAMEQPAGGQAATDLPLLPESDPQAKSLGYVEQASSVDAGKYPRYESGQACSNCALYMGGDAPQGACSIFPGKAVKATGWCSVYAPKAG